MAEPARSGCPINAAVEAFGDSWSLLVLRDVMFGNKRYFRELLAGSEEGIASNILADRLKRLVSAGLLTREDAGPGRRAAYSLTEASIQLVPVFAQLGEWGLRHRPTTKRLRVRAELLAAGGPELWREFMAELRTIHLGEPAPERTRSERRRTPGRGLRRRALIIRRSSPAAGRYAGVRRSAAPGSRRATRGSPKLRRPCGRALPIAIGPADGPGRRHSARRAVRDSTSLKRSACHGRGSRR